MPDSTTTETRPPPGVGPKVVEPLTDSVTHAVEEARMLIPGITVFIGFQLVAVFNQRFTILDDREQMAHVWATFLTLVALLLLLAPAAYHRQAERGWVSEGFVILSSRLITWGTPLFALGITIDFYLVVRIVSHSPLLAAAAALVILAISGVLWYAVPHVKPLERALRADQ